MALSELEKKRVWEAWFSGEVRSDYFGALSQQYQRIQTYTTWAILFLSSGAFYTLVTLHPDLPDWVPRLLTLVTTAVSLYAVVAQNQRRAMETSDLFYRWSRLSGEYRRLWDAMYAEDASARLAVLDEKSAELSKTCNAFPVKKALIDKSHAHVKGFHMYYATA